MFHRWFDVVVVGGGLSGWAAACRCARGGLQTLVLERRPVLGWEATWGFDLDLRGGTSEACQRLTTGLERVGGIGDGLMDAAILEMTLDEMLTDSGAELLYYQQPVAAVTDEQGVAGLVIAGKSGEHIIRGRAFLDATEQRLLFDLTGSGVDATRAPGMFSVFLNGIEELSAPMTVDMDDSAPGRLRPSLWPGEALLQFNLPERDIVQARRRLPSALAAAREQCACLEDAVVTHVSVEPAPVGFGPSPAPSDGRHRELSNLYSIAAWETEQSDEAASPAAVRIDVGTAAGERLVTEAGTWPPAERELPLVTSPASPPVHECDVVVCGGGTAGALAAIAAGREGARTALIESTTFLGGIGSGGGIHVYYHGITGGLQDEVDERVRGMESLFGPVAKVQGFNPEAKKVVLQQMAEEAGVALRFDTTITGVEVEELSSSLPARGRERAPRRLRGVIGVGPQGAATWRAAAVVDSSGDADVAFMAGAPFTFGRDGDCLPHAYSLAGGRLDDKGRMHCVNFDAGFCDPADPEDLTRARRLGLQHYRKQCFTPENRLLYIAPLLGLRNSRQIVGDYQVTLFDEISAREFPDVIAYAKSHYDNHALDYQNESDEAVMWVWLMGNWREPIGCEVPYRSLLPRGVEGLLVACRALSVTQDAHYQLRMQRDMQRIGEAAGIAAAMSAARGITPRELPVADLQQRLLATGALGAPERQALPADGQRGDSAALDLHATSKLPHPLPARPVEEWLEELDGDGCREAAWQLWQAGDEALPALLESVNAESPQRRFWAAVSLAMAGRPEAAPELIRCVEERRQDKAPKSESRPQVQAPAWLPSVVLLGRIADPAAVPALVDLLSDPDAGLDGLTAAVRALGRIGDPSAIEPIKKMLLRDDLPRRRMLKKSSPFSADVVKDAAWQLELAAAEALARLGQPRPDIVARYLSDERAYVRRYADHVRRLGGVAAGG